MKIVFLFFLIFMHNCNAVFDDHVNGEVKNFIDTVVAIGDETPQSDENQAIFCYKNLQRALAKNGVEDFWENPETAALLKKLIHTCQEDEEYRSHLDAALQKTIEMKHQWENVQTAFYHFMKKELSAHSTIQFPAFNNSPEYIKSFLEKNKNISQQEYPIIAVGSISLFKVLQDQRNALRKVGLI